MLEEILNHCSSITIHNRTNGATPEWIEKHGRYSVEVNGRQVATGPDVVKLVTDVELMLRVATETEILIRQKGVS